MMTITFGLLAVDEISSHKCSPTTCLSASTTGICCSLFATINCSTNSRPISGTTTMGVR